MLQRKGVCVAVVLAAWSATPIWAATQNWVPTTAGPFAYNSAANWNGGAGPVPGAADIAKMQLDLTADQSVTFPAFTSVHQLLIGDTAQTAGAYQKQSLSGGQITFMGPTGTAGDAVLTSQNGNNSIANNLISTSESGTGLTINVASGSLTLAGSLSSARYTFAGPGLKILTGTTAGPNTPKWDVSAGTLRAGGVNVFASPGYIAPAAGAVVDLNNFNQRVSAIGGGGTFALGSATLTIGGTFSGPLSFTGTGGLTVDASGDATYTDLTTATNSMSGPLTIKAGNVEINESSDVGAGGANNKIIFAPGGLTPTRSLIILNFAPAAISINRDMVLDASGLINGNNFTFAGNISGAGGLTLNSTNARLTGANSYAGDTIISYGSGQVDLGVIAADSALGAPSAGIVLGSNGLLGNAGGNFTTSRSFTNKSSNLYGGLLTGGGTMTFEGSGNNSFTGELWIRQGGTVAFNRTGGTTTVAPNAAVVLGGNATLILGGTTDTLSSGTSHANLALSNDALIVNQGTKNTGVVNGTGTITVNSGATLIVHAFRGLSSTKGITVAVNGTAKAELRHNGYADGTSKVQGLTIDPAASFDIHNNSLVWDYTGTTVKPLVRQYLMAGRGGAGGTPTWTSPGGITSSWAAAAGFPQNEAIGYLDNIDVAGGPYTTFGGLTGLDSSAIFIAHTIPGDANLDFIVNNSDLNIVGANYLQANVGDWYKGDYNYDGLVNHLDVRTLGSGWDPQTTTPTHAQLAGLYGQNFADAFYDGLAHPVPEPAGAMAMLVSAAAIAGRQRRKKEPRT